LHEEFVRSVRDEHIELAIALATITRNPATIIGAQRKGKIAVGMDADLNVLNKDTLALHSVMANGQWLLRDNTLVARTPFDH
jgi:beta-aspartyl-dipeptidase (metallo-type)